MSEETGADMDEVGVLLKPVGVVARTVACTVAGGWRRLETLMETQRRLIGGEEAGVRTLTSRARARGNGLTEDSVVLVELVGRCEGSPASWTCGEGSPVLQTMVLWCKSSRAWRCAVLQ